MKVVFGIMLIIAVLSGLTFLVIWSLNTLFPVLAIPYTLETWSAIVLLHGLTGIWKLSYKK